MADEQKNKSRLEIAHVLFIDIVGYSKLLVKQQSELLSELNEVVCGTNEFCEAESAEKLIRLPTGDGMALVFRTDPEAPVQCAIEIARALKSHPAIQLRMGIHSGHGVPVVLSLRVEDPDAHFARAKAAGAVVVRELQDEPYGSRGYMVKDPEEHLWYFGTYHPRSYWE